MKPHQPTSTSRKRNQKLIVVLQHSIINRLTDNSSFPMEGGCVPVVRTTISKGELSVIVVTRLKLRMTLMESPSIYAETKANGANIIYIARSLSLVERPDLQEVCDRTARRQGEILFTTTENTRTKSQKCHQQ